MTTSLQTIYLYEGRILIKISPRFFPKGPFDNASIGSENGFRPSSVPNRPEAIAWTNVDFSSFETLGIYQNEYS